MEKWLEPTELIKNRDLIKKMLTSVSYKMPTKIVEARRVMNYKQFLANVLLIIQAVYDDNDS